MAMLRGAENISLDLAALDKADEGVVTILRVPIVRGRSINFAALDKMFLYYR